VTRFIAQLLSDYFGQSFIIDNRSGAAGDIATEAVVHTAPDGYTLLVVLAANAINATLHQKLKFSPVRDLAMVAGLARVPNVLEINPAVPATTVSPECSVTTATRSPTLPDVPSISEFVPEFQAGSWWGLAAPKDTPYEIIHLLNYGINAILSYPGTKTRLAELGTTPFVYSPGAFTSFVEIETDKWARVLKFSGTKGD
jgi:tripartite-type tricarboxylate transporter receptor subunit TctC